MHQNKASNVMEGSTVMLEIPNHYPCLQTMTCLVPSSLSCNLLLSQHDLCLACPIFALSRRNLTNYSIGTHGICQRCGRHPCFLKPFRKCSPTLTLVSGTPPQSPHVALPSSGRPASTLPTSALAEHLASHASSQAAAQATSQSSSSSQTDRWAPDACLQSPALRTFNVLWCASLSC